MWQGEGPAGAHLTADHDVRDFGLAVAAVRLVVSSADRQDEVAGVTLALPHQEAAVLALLRQQLLSLPARQVSVEPSGERSVGGKRERERRRKTCRIKDDLIWSDACKLFPFSKYNWMKRALRHCNFVMHVTCGGANSPLRGRVGAVEWVLELNDVPIFLLQLPVMLHVILHQLCQGGKLLSAIKVVVISCVLDFNVGDGTISPARGKKERFSSKPLPFSFG